MLHSKSKTRKAKVINAVKKAEKDGMSFLQLLMGVAMGAFISEWLNVTHELLKSYNIPMQLYNWMMFFILPIAIWLLWLPVSKRYMKPWDKALKEYDKARK